MEFSPHFFKPYMAVAATCNAALDCKHQFIKYNTQLHHAFKQES